MQNLRNFNLTFLSLELREINMNCNFFRFLHKSTDFNLHEFKRGTNDALTFLLMWQFCRIFREIDQNPNVFRIALFAFLNNFS